MITKILISTAQFAVDKSIFIVFMSILSFEVNYQASSTDVSLKTEI